MLFRCIILTTDKRVPYIYTDTSSNWVDFRGRSYRKDRKAVFQVVEEGKALKGLVELFYFEGNPIPLTSNLDVKTITSEHVHEKEHEACNQPEQPKRWGLF